MSDQMQGQGGDLVLPPNTYAFVQDNTKGKVSVLVGPFKSSPSNTDQLVVWSDDQQRVVPINTLAGAVKTFTTAAEGQYIVLTNPVGDERDQYPQKGNASDSVELEFGRRVIVPGPAQFPLWPGQTAQVIDGHHLRHNEYLLVRVYDVDLARENWRNTVAAPQASPEGETDVVLPSSAANLTMGQLLIIRGTDVSFYMPSTGVEVIPDGTNYVRSAVTLETLEYCILLDENGSKRYEQGDAVVFPEPTEKFIEGDDGCKVFQAIELNEQSGLYVKVIEEYEDARGSHAVGEELFITGREQAIYFPRTEHSIITYDKQRKHHAIALPAGEGRYVLNRDTGQVELVRGPQMLLPDPRKQVVVKRVLDQHDCEIMYPGNEKALDMNEQYRAMTTQVDDHLAGAVMNNMALASYNSAPIAVAAATLDSFTPADSFEARDPGRRKSFAGDTMSRQTSYSPPRTITLDTKYEGAVQISPWAGYAVLITDKSGNRRVEVGPQVIQLQYDETIMPLELSTGRPKKDKNLLKTGYLRVINNAVTDLVTVETRDFVSVDIEIIYRVNFEGETPEDREKWFNVENYVQVLADHCRSRLRNVAKRSDIREFYTNPIDIIRDTLLGVQPADGRREGLFFPENNMRLSDIEVTNVTIRDAEAANLLTQAQSAALSGDIQLATAEDKARRDHQLNLLRREAIRDAQKVRDVEVEVEEQRIAQDLEQNLARATAEFTVRIENIKLDEKNREARMLETQTEVAIGTMRNEVALARIEKETELYIDKLKALSPELVDAIRVSGQETFVETIVTAVAPLAMAGGVTTADILGQTFEGTAFEGVIKAFAERPLAVASTSNGAR